MKRIFVLGLLGALAGALTAVISTPFYDQSSVGDLMSVLEAGTVDVRDTVTFGTVFGHLGEFLLGAFVASFLTFYLLRNRSPLQRWTTLAVAFVLGGALSCGIDAALDYSFIRAMYNMNGGYEGDLFKTLGMQTLWKPFWYFLSPGSIAFAILAASGFSKYYRGLAWWAMLFGGIAGYIARTIASVLILVVFVGSAVASQDVNSAAAGSGVIEFGAMFIAQGAGLGIGFGLAIMVHKPAWLKSISGSSEGRTWALQGSLSRIGCQEGIEVWLPADGTVAPVHAQIQAEEEAHYIVDIAGSTSVNGQPVQTQWLNDGDLVTVGSSTLLFRTRLRGQAKGEEVPQAVAMSPAPIQMPVIVDPLGHEHILHPGINVVGREVGCDIALTWENGVSRRHAELVVDQNGVTVNDLGSTNGTFIDGVQLSEPSVLAPGQTVAFGTVVCTLK